MSLHIVPPSLGCLAPFGIPTSIARLLALTIGEPALGGKEGEEQEKQKVPPHPPAPSLSWEAGGGRWGVGGINLGLLATQGPRASKGGGGGDVNGKGGRPLIPFPDFLCGLPLTLF